MKIIDLSQEPGDVVLDMNQSYWIKGLNLNTLRNSKKSEAVDRQPQVFSASTRTCDAQLDTGSGNGSTTNVGPTLTNPNQLTRFQPNRTHRRRP